jgi:hypothetical protein
MQFRRSQRSRDIVERATGGRRAWLSGKEPRTHGICIREADTRKERRFYSPEQMRRLVAVLPDRADL